MCEHRGHRHTSRRLPTHPGTPDAQGPSVHSRPADPNSNAAHLSLWPCWLLTGPSPSWWPHERPAPSLFPENQAGEAPGPRTPASPTTKLSLGLQASPVLSGTGVGVARTSPPETDSRGETLLSRGETPSCVLLLTLAATFFPRGPQSHGHWRRTAQASADLGVAPH